MADARLLFVDVNYSASIRKGWYCQLCVSIHISTTMHTAMVQHVVGDVWGVWGSAADWRIPKLFQTDGKNNKAVESASSKIASLL